MSFYTELFSLWTLTRQSQNVNLRCVATDAVSKTSRSPMLMGDCALQGRRGLSGYAEVKLWTGLKFPWAGFFLKWTFCTCYSHEIFTVYEDLVLNFEGWY